MTVATQLRKGMIILYRGELYRVLNTMHVTPGNKRGFVQAQMKGLKSGIQAEVKFSSGDEIERAILEQHEMEFLYSDGGGFHFMNAETYEQVMLSAEVISDYAKFLQPNCRVKVDFYEERAVAIELPQMMTFKVVEADPAVKRSTASAQFKNATLENGLVIRVPSFVEAGDMVVIDTETGEYLERG